jgi:hypothetical protein
MHPSRVASRVLLLLVAGDEWEGRAHRCGPASTGAVRCARRSGSKTSALRPAKRLSTLSFECPCPACALARPASTLRRSHASYSLASLYSVITLRARASGSSGCTGCRGGGILVMVHGASTLATTAAGWSARPAVIFISTSPTAGSTRWRPGTTRTNRGERCQIRDS